MERTHTFQMNRIKLKCAPQSFDGGATRDEHQGRERERRVCVYKDTPGFRPGPCDGGQG